MPTGHCQVLLPPCPLEAEIAGVASQQGLPCGPIGTVTTGQKPVVDGFPDRPHSIQIPHWRQSPSTYEAILSGHPQQSMILTRCGLPRSPRGLGWCQSSNGSMPSEDVVDRSTSQTHATSNNTLPHALTGKCNDFMSDTYRGWLKQSVKIENNMQVLIRTCHSAKANLGKCPPKLQFWNSTIPRHWSESSAKVRPDFVGEQSQVYFMSISAHWTHKNSTHIDFIATNVGATTFFQEWTYPSELQRFDHLSVGMVE